MYTGYVESTELVSRPGPCNKSFKLINLIHCKSKRLRASPAVLRMWRRPLIANYLDQYLWLANEKQGAKSYHIYYALLWQVWDFAGPQQTVQNLPKRFCWAILANLNFSSSNANLEESHSEHQWSCSWHVSITYYPLFYHHPQRNCLGWLFSTIKVLASASSPLPKFKS